MSSIEEVLQFWFGELGEDGRASSEASARWWKKDPDFDQEIRERFGSLHREISNGEHDDWAESPRGLLAMVIVLDQFSRNMFRDTPKMYATDEQALELAYRGIERGDDRKLAFAERTFLYMPPMHSEELEDQERCVELFQSWVDELEGEKRETIEYNLDYAIQHLDIVARFGRFPHRNEILGRETTEEEREFLKTPGSSF